jgi:hypothetical protein
MRIPYSTEQGIILADRDSWRENREFYRPELKSSPDKILGRKDLWVNVRYYPKADIDRGRRNDLEREKSE